MLTHLLVALVGAILFPGAESAPSPDGRLLLEYRAPQSDVAVHRLFLTNASSGASSQVHSFSRHVGVLWAPDSSHVAITDWTGSDESRVVLVAVAAPGTPTILDRGRIQASIPLGRDHHFYVEASRWLSGQELLLRVHGYGEAHPKGFERILVYSIAGQSITERPAGT